MTKKQIIQYLIDCNGYGLDYLTPMTKEELKELVTDWEQCQQYNY